ncbi:MAG: DUF4159 domain-containing protein [Elusimicrobiota bacterium]
MKKCLIFILLLLHFSLPCRAEDILQGNKFVFTQLIYKGNWDLRARAWSEIYPLLTATTSIKIIPQRKTITLTDPKLFSSPLVWWVGDSGFSAFSSEELECLSRWITNGGLFVIDDLSGEPGSPFFKAVKNQLAQAAPEGRWEIIPADYAVFRSFYLMSQAGGRRIISRNLEGFYLDGQLLAIYSANDLLGVWERTPLGEYVYDCLPGGDTQRLEAKKLTLNLIIFSLTDTYKSDVIHKSYLQYKLGR